MEIGLNKVKTELKNLKTPQSSEDKFFCKNGGELVIIMLKLII